MERLKFVGYSYSMLSHFSYEVSPKLMTNISVRYQFKKCTTVHLNKILIFLKILCHILITGLSYFFLFNCKSYHYYVAK